MAEAKCAQVIFEAVAKSAEIILLNRITDGRALARSPGRTRFNLEVDEVAVLRGMMEYWRRDLHLPLRLLVVWRPRDGSAPELLERWEIHFSMGPALTGREDEAVLLGQVRALWKRIMVLLRTLYSHSLSLPAAQLQRRAELAARTGNGRGASGCLAFAVCTREADSEAWLLLNGHSEASYQPNPPLAFLLGAAVRASNLPAARCAFGSFTVAVQYAETKHIDAAQHHDLESRIFSEPPAAALGKSPSGLSVLLMQAPPPPAFDSPAARQRRHTEGGDWAVGGDWADEPERHSEGASVHRPGNGELQGAASMKLELYGGQYGPSAALQMTEARPASRPMAVAQSARGDRLDLLLAAAAPSDDEAEPLARPRRPAQSLRDNRPALAAAKPGDWRLAHFVAPFGYGDARDADASPRPAPASQLALSQTAQLALRRDGRPPKPKSPKASWGTPPFAQSFGSPAAHAPIRYDGYSPPFAPATPVALQLQTERPLQRLTAADRVEEEGPDSGVFSDGFASLLLASASSPFRDARSDQDDDDAFDAPLPPSPTHSPWQEDSPPPFAFEPEPATTADALAEIVHAAAHRPTKSERTWAELERDLSECRAFGRSLET